MLLFTKVFILLCPLVFTKDYSNYRMITVFHGGTTPINAELIEKARLKTESKIIQIDYNNKELVAIVAPHSLEKFLEFWMENGFDTDILNENIQR